MKNLSPRNHTQDIPIKGDVDLKVSTSQIGVAGGVASLDTSAHVPVLELPTQNSNEAALKRWREAIAEIATKPADVLLLGDSIMEGYFATSNSKRVSELIRKSLQAKYNPLTVRGGEGFVPARHALDPAGGGSPAPLPDLWTYNTVTRGSWAERFGLAQRSVITDASGDYIERTFTGDRFWLFFTRALGRAEILVNGVSHGFIDTWDGGGGGLGTLTYDSGVLTRGTYTVRVRGATGSAAGAGYDYLIVLEGGMFFDGDGGAVGANAGKGVRVWDAAKAGTKATDWDGPSQTNDGYWAESLSLVSPDLVIIEFGSNEYYASEITAFETALAALVDYIRSKAPAPLPSILILASPGVIWGSGSESLWGTFVTVMRLVAKTKGCAFLDLTQDFSFPTSSSNTALYADGIHPNDGGSAEMARHIVRAIAPESNLPGIPIVKADDIREFYVEDYGAVGDGTTDDAVAIQAANDAAEAAGGGYVVFKSGKTYATTTTLTNDSDFVTWIAKGGGKYTFDHTVGGAIIKWIGTGSSAGPIVHFAPIGAFTRRAVGGGMIGITANCGTATDHALTGIKITSRASGRWDIGVFNVRAGGVGLDVTTHASASATFGDTQGNLFERVAVSVNGNHSGTCIRLTSGATGSNVSRNKWGFVSVQYGDGHGIDMQFCDADLWEHISGTRLGASTTGRCIIMRAQATDIPPRHFAISYLQPGAGGILFEGTAVNTYPPRDIRILSYSLDNSSTRATWGAGAKAHIAYNDGVSELDGLTQPASPVMTVKAADQTKTSDTTLAADTHLGNVAIAANETWLIEYDLHVISASDTGDFKIQITAPGGATGWWTAVGPGSAATGTGAASLRVNTLAFGDVHILGATTNGWLVKVTVVVVNGANSGNITFLWAQNTSSASGTTVKAASIRRAVKIS